MSPLAPTARYRRAQAVRPSSAGGDFSVPPGGIGDGFGLSALLPPTDLAFGQPDNRELFPSLLKPNSTPSIIDLTPSVGGGDTIVYEKGLKPVGSAARPTATAEINTGTFTITSPDGVGSLTHRRPGDFGCRACQQRIDADQHHHAARQHADHHRLRCQHRPGELQLHARPQRDPSRRRHQFHLRQHDRDGDRHRRRHLGSRLRCQSRSSTTCRPAIADTDSVRPAAHGTPSRVDVSCNDVFGADSKGADGRVGWRGQGRDACGPRRRPARSRRGPPRHLRHADAAAPTARTTYVRDAGSPGGVNDTFTYTIKDGDGDLSHTTLTITVGDSTPTDHDPGAGRRPTTVYEAGLPRSGCRPAPARSPTAIRNDSTPPRPPRAPSASPRRTAIRRSRSAAMC